MQTYRIQTIQWLKQHYFLLAAVVIASLFIFLNLGARVFWVDEAQTAILSRTILKNGVPTFYDGKNLIVDHPFNLSLNSYISDKLADFEENKAKYSVLDYLWKWQPWIQNYLMAAFYSVLGENSFASRLPFAISGLLTVIFSYFFVLKLFKSKSLANLFLLLLITSVPFYLHTRQARYYSLAMLMTVLTLYSYYKLTMGEKYSRLYFVASSILLFYTFYIAFFSTYSAILIQEVFFNRKKKIFGKFVFSTILILILTLPWFLFIDLFSKAHSFNLHHIFFGLTYLSSYLFFYIFPIIFIFFIPALIISKRLDAQIKANHTLLLSVVITGVICSTFGPWDLPSFRYTSFLIPILIIEISFILLYIKKNFKYFFLALLLILIFSNFLLIYPLKLFEKSLLGQFSENSDEYYFLKENLQPRYDFISLFYEITHPYKGPNEYIVEYLKKNANQDETFVSNSDYIIYAFYTNMRFEKDINKTPDWIILRKPYLLWGGTASEGAYLFNFSYDRYEKIILNSTDYTYLLDSPEPRKHRFVRNSKMISLDRYETYPVEIYRLKKP